MDLSRRCEVICAAPNYSTTMPARGCCSTFRPGEVTRRIARFLVRRVILLMQGMWVIPYRLRSHALAAARHAAAALVVDLREPNVRVNRDAGKFAH